MLKLKDNSVIAKGTRPELWYGISVVEKCFAALGFDTIITSLTDGQHNCRSLHPKGLAADFRVKHVVHNGEMLPNTIMLIFEDIKKALKPYGFDVVPEGGVAGEADQNTRFTTGAHIHIEFDPKPGIKYLVCDIAAGQAKEKEFLG